MKNEGKSYSRAATVESFPIAEGTLCLRLTGTITHLHFGPLVDLLDQGARTGEFRALVLDLNEMDALEPGVAGRLIANCSAKDLRFPYTAIVTKSAGVVAIARAAAVVLKRSRIDVVSTRVEALARCALFVAPARAAAPRGRRPRQQSGEQARPGVALLAKIEDATKRNAG
jgi:hypothetical protein